MEKKLRLLWSVSLLLISCITITSAGCNIFSIELPDLVKRIMGVLDLLAIPVLIFSSIKLKILKKTNNDAENDQ